MSDTTPTTSLRIWRVHDGVWWFGRTLEEVLDDAVEGLGLERAELLLWAEELTAEQLERMRYVDEDPEKEMPEEGWPVITFAARLAALVQEGATVGSFAWED